ncbi:MAG: dihydroorotase family protein [Candidatus Micrarchaeia archaeon]|jgi:dihydroorotase
MIITNGFAASATGGRKADIRVSAGKIAKIAPRITPARGEEVFDAKGLCVLPGLVDCHVHFRDPGNAHKEDFHSGTASALAGGVTTIIDMPNNAPATTTLAALHEKKAIASKKAVCDYAFQFGATQDNFADAARAGKDNSVAALKIFFGSSTGNMLVESHSAILLHLAAFNKSKPVCFHAEDEEAIRRKTEAYKKEFPRASVKLHNLVRPPHAAESAVLQILSLALEAKRKVHLCHVSTAGELRQLAACRKRGAKVSCEATPHHLMLSEEDLARLGNYGKVNPPLRSKEDRAAVWAALAAGRIDCIASDHAPHTREEKRQPYWNAPSGMPGVETTLPLMLTAVAAKKLPLPKLVQLASTNPARVFNLKNKGAIAVGKDADLVLVDLKRRHAISADKLHSRCGWTAFEGFPAVGSVERVFLRGKLAFDGKNILLKPGEGRVAALSR